MPILVIRNLSDFPSFDIYIIFLNVCMSVCPLPFFLTMAKPFPLKLGSSLGYGVGQTAKHFGTKLGIYGGLRWSKRVSQSH